MSQEEKRSEEEEGTQQTSQQISQQTTETSLPSSLPAEDDEGETAYHPGQANWSIHNLPDILYLLKPTEQHAKRRDPVPMTPYKVFGRHVRDFPMLPRQISSGVEGWRVEAWFRLDRRIQPNDIIARMDPRRCQSVNPHMIEGRRLLFRRAFNISKWGSGSSIAAHTRELQRHGIDPAHNSTRGLTPGLIDPAKGEAGGRVALPLNWMAPEDPFDWPAPRLASTRNRKVSSWSRYSNPPASALYTEIAAQARQEALQNPSQQIPSQQVPLLQTPLQGLSQQGPYQNQYQQGLSQGTPLLQTPSQGLSQQGPLQHAPLQQDRYQQGLSQQGLAQQNPYHHNAYQGNPYQQNPYQQNPYHENPYQQDDPFHQGPSRQPSQLSLAERSSLATSMLIARHSSLLRQQHAPLSLAQQSSPGSSSLLASFQTSSSKRASSDTDITTPTKKPRAGGEFTEQSPQVKTEEQGGKQQGGKQQGGKHQGGKRQDGKRQDGTQQHGKQHDGKRQEEKQQDGKQQHGEQATNGDKTHPSKINEKPAGEYPLESPNLQEWEPMYNYPILPTPPLETNQGSEVDEEEEETEAIPFQEFLEANHLTYSGFLKRQAEELEKYAEYRRTYRTGYMDPDLL